MSAKQLKTCAERLPEPERSAFLADHARASDLIQEAAALRRAAWQRYRMHVQSGEAKPQGTSIP